LVILAMSVSLLSIGFSTLAGRIASQWLAAHFDATGLALADGTGADQRS